MENNNKWHSREIASEIIEIWLRKRNSERKTESLLIAAQNDAMGINHIKAKIDNTQQKIKSRLFDDRNILVNHIISEFSKLTKK